MGGGSKFARAFRRCRTLVFVFSAAFVLLLLDQLTKAWADRALNGTDGICVVPHLFNLYFVPNRGCAWGLFQGSVLPLAVFAMLAFATLLWKRRTIFGEGRVAFATETLLYAGIIGNLVDRLARGFVVDFLDFHWYAHHFPVFNCADVYISVAAGLLLLSSFLQKRKA